MRAPRTRSLATLLAVVLAIGACEDPIRPPDPGAIRVIVIPNGEDIRAEELRVSVANGPLRPLDSGRVTLVGIAPGVYAVRLDGVAPNCQVAGANPRSVTVASNDTTTVAFTMPCVARVGSVRSTTATTGVDLDPDGYTATVIGGPSAVVAVNGTATITNVREGQHLMTLGGLSPNCAITGPDTLSVTVQLGGTSDVTFAIACVAVGAMTVTVATTGVAPDPNGYTLDVQASSVGFTRTLSIAPNGTVTFPALRPAADYRISLQGGAANCEVADGAVRTVAVMGGSTTAVAFTVACGPPGLLAFVRNEDIYVIASNGTGATRLTTDPAFDGEPAWSSGGRIAFTTRRHSDDLELYVMNADGTNQVRLTTTAGTDDSPSWSPDGARIVFRSERDVNSEIYVVNADGTGLTRLTNNAAADFQPAWSSTGRIAFVSDRDHSAGEIYVMNEDGSNVVRLTNNEIGEFTPAWSADGSMIAFMREVCYYYCPQDLFVMNADGANQRQVSDASVDWSVYRSDPSWSPNGRAIALTREYCPYYCEPPAIFVVDPQGTRSIVITDPGSNPAWKP